MFLGSAEPRELRVQCRDGLGGRVEPRWEEHSGVWLGLDLSRQAGTPVAGLSFAAARADTPQLLRRLIK